MQQDYASYRVYILDDSSDPAIRARIDAFAAEYSERVTVVRRGDRRAYKAGNLNHALASIAREPLFALVDADEILPTDFLARLVPRILAIPDCGFIQANHRSNPNATSALARDLGPGVDSHWRWYHPLRNDYGFVMLLGHGALIRRQAWVDAGGFPELVSEDLAFALRAREAGWRGRFAEDVVCIEEFPEDVRAFRVRHMKWTRGTCEFLSREAGRLLLTHRLSWVEKIDILLPTLNLPLSFLFFLFVHRRERRPHRAVRRLPRHDVGRRQPRVAGADAAARRGVCGAESARSVRRHDSRDGVARAVLPDRHVAPAGAPVVVPGAKHGALRRARAAVVDRRAAVRGDAACGVSRDGGQNARAGGRSLPRRRCQRWRNGLHEFALRSHPDQKLVQGLEIACALVLVALACATFQIPFLGLALGYLMFPVMHHVRWDALGTRALVHIPFALIVSGFGIGSLSLLGVQTVFFGYGFHF